MIFLLHLVLFATELGFTVVALYRFLVTVLSPSSSDNISGVCGTRRDHFVWKKSRVTCEVPLFFMCREPSLTEEIDNHRHNICYLQLEF